MGRITVDTHKYIYMPILSFVDPEIALVFPSRLMTTNSLSYIVNIKAGDDLWTRRTMQQLWRLSSPLRISHSQYQWIKCNKKLYRIYRHAHPGDDRNITSKHVAIWIQSKTHKLTFGKFLSVQRSEWYACRGQCSNKLSSVRVMIYALCGMCHLCKFVSLI